MIKRLEILLQGTLKKDFNLACKKEGRTMTDVLKELIRKYIKIINNKKE